MLERFIFLYLLVDVFCFYFSIIIYSKVTIDMGTEREVRALRLMIITFDAFLVADAIWAMGTYDTWLIERASIDVVEAIAMLLMGFVAYFWVIFVENRLQARYVNRKLFPLVTALPLMITALLYVTTSFTGWIYAIGPGNAFTYGPLSPVPALVPIVYVLFTAIHAFKCLLREKSSTRRRECLTLIWFAIPPIAFGVVDLVMHGMPVMAISVFASLLLVFITSQDLRINTDALTGLNNRRRATEYAEDALSDLSEESRLCAFIIDVDYFKDINDTYGHGEGDRALQVIADGLRHAMDGRKGLAARWGGDEFLAVVFLDDDGNPQEFEQCIVREVEAARIRANVECGISVSTGYALAQRGESLADLIGEADRLLYEQKAVHHGQAKQAG